MGTGREIPCQDCHYATTHDGVTIATSGTHINALNEVGATVGTYNNLPLNVVYAAPNCTTISCHGGYKGLAWTITTTSCDNCHGSFIGTGGMATTVVARHRTADWTLAARFRRSTRGSRQGRRRSATTATRTGRQRT